jgi:NAD(P)-dependent dehydrogenase (short-subunit alcohol dehydrogenase family)
LIITGRTRENIQTAQKKLPESRVEVHQLDASDREATTKLYKSIERLDYLILIGAGNPRAGLLREIDEDSLRGDFDSKFFAHWRAIKELAPKVKRSITLLLGAAGRSAIPGTSNYAAVNGALAAMIPPLAIELSPLRINAVSAGVTESGFWQWMPESERQSMYEAAAAALPVRRIASASDIAEAVLFAAVNEFATGAIFDVDGGARIASSNAISANKSARLQ